MDSPDGTWAVSESGNVAKRLGAKLVPSRTGCLEFVGYRTSKGYGRLGLSRVKGPRPAHRIAWELVHGPIPEGFCVLHRCDNPPCCNVDHLFLGTRAENSQDMVTKGRSCRGEKNSQYRLTQEQVTEIRSLAGRGTSNHAIAQIFGVHHTYVGQILSGKKRIYG